jgi:mono/diheme cytochrome c family protein
LPLRDGSGFVDNLDSLIVSIENDRMIEQRLGRKNMNLQRILTTTSLFAALAWPISNGLAGEADAGKALYQKNCVGCHGADGKGNPAMIKAMGEKGLNIVTKETMQKSDEVLLKIIAEGAGKMPPSKKLSADEQKTVLKYNRSLAK